MMMSDLPDNVREVIDCRGKPRYRFRRKGWKSAYLKGPPGSEAFHRSYADILAAGPEEPIAVETTRTIAAKSIDDLIARFKKTVRWKKKGPRTQYKQARILERFADRVDKRGRRYGARPISDVSVTWLENILGTMVETPAAANELRKILAGLLDCAVRMEWRTDNPARLTEKYEEGEGLHDWTDVEIEQYRATHALGTMARLTLELALNTAARRCNVNKIERDHLKGGRILVDHAKGNNDASVPMLATTKAAIDALPATPIRFLIITQFGKPFSDAGLGNRMRKWCDEAKLHHCSLHGLRKAMSRQLAESGATDAEGKAVTGHKKDSTFAYYRAKANRVTLADRAMSNMGPLAIVQHEENDGDTDV
jgi:integrase